MPMEIIIAEKQTPFAGAIPLRNPDGCIMIGGKEVADTKSCAHCGCHWVPIKGSKRIRGHCDGCHGDLCGQPECMVLCMPLEEYLRRCEGSKAHVKPY